jgi:hypothetical protein
LFRPPAAVAKIVAFASFKLPPDTGRCHWRSLSRPPETSLETAGLVQTTARHGRIIAKCCFDRQQQITVIARLDSNCRQTRKNCHWQYCLGHRALAENRWPHSNCMTRKEECHWQCCFRYAEGNSQNHCSPFKLPPNTRRKNCHWQYCLGMKRSLKETAGLSFKLP